MIIEKHRILIFCDDIWSMNYVHSQLKSEFMIIGIINMSTSIENREDYVEKFLCEENNAKILMLSRTGDEGIDVPSASKLIQICTPWGSRRQHAQRIGRVQRPSSEKNICCEAITLVSEGTSEVEFAQRRDEYLKEMGYDVHNSFLDIDLSLIHI